LPSAKNSLIDCFYRIIAVNRRVNPRIGIRKEYPSAELGIFLDKRVGFAGGGLAKRWRYGGDCGYRFADLHRRQRRRALALLGRGMGWGNAGVGNLTVGCVPEADIDDVKIYSGRLPIDS
jgi:hypothetical protein